jgi:hypothetical protein
VPVHDDTLTSTTPAPDADAPVRRSNRGFFLVAGAIVLSCLFVVIEIFANFGMKDTIAHAEYTLTKAKTAIGLAQDRGTETLDATRMTAVEPTLLWVPGDQGSTGLEVVSLATEDAAWGIAVQAKPGACFYLHRTGSGDVFYGVGTVCTGEQALQATDPRW